MMKLEVSVPGIPARWRLLAFPQSGREFGTKSRCARRSWSPLQFLPEGSDSCVYISMYSEIISTVPPVGRHWYTYPTGVG